MNIAELHTLIIRTRNRHDWLKQTLDQYVSANYSGLIHIEDDSNDNIFIDNAEFIKSIEKSLKIFHFKGAGSNLKTRTSRMIETSIEMVKKISTKYYTFSSDDDFYLETFTKNAIDFLERNSEYSCVIGPEIKLFYDEKRNINYKKRKYWHGSYFDDPLDRIIDYAISPSLPNYGVCRTDMFNLLVESSKITNRVCFSNKGSVDLEYFDEEFPWCLLVFISGKVKYLPSKIMHFRGIHEGDDRVERLYKRNDLKGYSLGSIYPLSKPTGWKRIKFMHDDLLNLLKISGSQYDDQILSDSIMRILWHILSKYNGFGAVNPNTKIWEIREKKLKLSPSRSLINRLSFSINLRLKRASTFWAESQSQELRKFLSNNKKII